MRSLVRAIFPWAAWGNGFAGTSTELRALVDSALVNVPHIFMDESPRGWKELEKEVVRDASNNWVALGNMENFDPMKIHTVDSIVVPPSQTLTNSEYLSRRECSVTVVRYLGVGGECNIQYALDPQSQVSHIMVVNARRPHSGALASKATAILQPMQRQSRRWAATGRGCDTAQHTA